MEKKTISTTFKRFLRHNAVLLCLALLIVYFSIRRPAFIAPDNIMTIIRQGACTGILAVGLAHVLIIGGTSLAVYPAAGLIDYFQGDKLVVINKSATPRDSHADLLVQGPIGEVFHSIQNP